MKWPDYHSEGGFMYRDVKGARTMPKKMIAAIMLISAIFSSGRALAHHSFAMFDNQKEVTVSGTVKDFQWTNPHCWISLIAVDSTGHQAEWTIEGSSPNNLVRSGWKRTTLKPGDKIDIVIHPMRDGSNGGSLMSAVVNGQPVSADK